MACQSERMGRTGRRSRSADPVERRVYELLLLSVGKIVRDRLEAGLSVEDHDLIPGMLADRPDFRWPEGNLCYLSWLVTLGDEELFAFVAASTGRRLAGRPLVRVH